MHYCLILHTKLLMIAPYVLRLCTANSFIIEMLLWLTYLLYALQKWLHVLNQPVAVLLAPVDSQSAC